MEGGAAVGHGARAERWGDFEKEAPALSLYAGCQELRVGEGSRAGGGAGRAGGRREMRGVYCSCGVLEVFSGFEDNVHG